MATNERNTNQRRSDEETTEVWDRPKKYMENAHNESTCAIVERSGEIGLRLMSTPSKKSKVSGMSIDEMFTICPQCNVSDEKMRTRSQGKLRTLPSCCLDTVHARRKRNSAPRCCQEKSKDGLQYTCISQNCRMNKKRKLVFWEKAVCQFRSLGVQLTIKKLCLRHHPEAKAAELWSCNSLKGSVAALFATIDGWIEGQCCPIQRVCRYQPR